MNYIIPQRDDGTANMDINDPEQLALFVNSITAINHLWSNLKRPNDPDCYPSDDFLPDTRIRFALNEVVVIRDSRYNDSDAGAYCPNDRNWYMNGLDSVIRSDPRYQNAVNVYCTNPYDQYIQLVNFGDTIDDPYSKPPCSEFPSHTKLNKSSRINLSGLYNKFIWMRDHVEHLPEYKAKGLTWEESIHTWMSGSFNHTMTHELGHTMGLSHHNEHHGRNKCDESILHQGHGQPHNYLQPTEIGKIHRNMRMSNLRQFLAEDVQCEQAWLIEDSVGVSMSYWAYEDIIVEDGAVLYVSCDLSLHERGKLIVRPGGRVVIDGGSIGHRSDTNIAGLLLERERGWFLFRKRARKTGTLSGDIAAYKGSVIERKQKR